MIALFFSVIAVVIAVDLITKFNIEGILNPGIAWSLGADVTWLWIVVVIFSFALTIALVTWFLLQKRRTGLGTVGLALFVGGMLGNAIDRLVTGGAVHDFINFIIFRNNLADIALTVGAILIVLSLIREEFRASR